MALVAWAAASGCAPERASPAPPPTSHLIYAATSPPGLSLPPVARIGRGRAPGRLTPQAVRAAQPGEPLQAPMIWQLPDGGDDGSGAAGDAAGAPTLAAVAGSDRLGPAVELIDVDAGVLRWRVREPAGPIVGVTATAIIGAGRGTWALDLDGEPLWQTESEFSAMAGDVVAVASAMEQVTMLVAATGRELWRATLPPPLQASEVRWACAGAGRDLLLIDERGTLHRVVEREDAAGAGAASAGEARVAWSAAEPFAHAEGCGGDVLAVTPSDELGSYELVLLERQRGAEKARVAGVRGHWPLPGGGLIIAGVAGVRRHDAALRPGRLLLAAVLGPRLASRGARALVRTETGLALLDGDGEAGAPVAVQPIAATADSAALGARSILTSVWSRSPAYQVRRGGLPAPSSAPRTSDGGDPRVATPRPATSLAAVALSRAAEPALPPALLVDATELGAVPATAPPRLELAAPAEPALAVAVATGVVAVLRGEAGPQLARYRVGGPLAWSSARGCEGERVLGLAVSAGDPAAGPARRGAAEAAAGAAARAEGGRVLCLGGSATGPSTLVASDLVSGEVQWTRQLAADEVQLSAALALVRSGDRATVLRASDGAPLASWRSDDGERVRAALISAGGAALVVSVEGDAVVARWPLAAMIPVWTVAVDGVVTDVQADGDRVLVALAGGEAVSLRGADGAASPIAGEAARWLASGDGILGLTEQRDSLRLALYARDGALRWAHDLTLPGPIEVLPSAQRGASALLYGEARDRGLPVGERGLGAPVALPESAATAIWVRLLTSPSAAPRWIGVSTSAARWWSL